MGTRAKQRRVSDHGELAAWPDHARPGTRLAGKYRVDWVLGLGRATLVRASHTVVDMPVVIEVLSCGDGRDEQAEAGFLAEARDAMQSSERPRVMDVDRLADGTPYRVVDAAGVSDPEAYVLSRGCRSFVTHSVDETIAACAELVGAKPPQERRKKALARTEVAGWTQGRVTPAAEATSLDGQSSATEVRRLLLSLFRRLCGKPAFKGGSNTELVAMVLTTEPRKLATERPDLDPRLAQVIDDGIGASDAEAWASPVALMGALAPFASPHARQLASEASLTVDAPAAAPAPVAAAVREPQGAPVEARSRRPAKEHEPPGKAYREKEAEEDRAELPRAIPMRRAPWAGAMGVVVAVAALAVLAFWLFGDDTVPEANLPASSGEAVLSAPDRASSPAPMTTTAAASPTSAAPTAPTAPSPVSSLAPAATATAAPSRKPPSPVSTPGPTPPGPSPTASALDYGGRK